MIGSKEHLEPKLPLFGLEEKLNPKPIEVLGSRELRSKRKSKKEIFVRWEGQGQEDAMWVEGSRLKKAYPYLEGKVF